MSQSLSSRLVAIPVNIIIAVPYGFYRDRAMRLARHISPSGWMKNVADVVAYVTFQSPVYVAILFVVGADWHQICRGGEFEYRRFNADGRGVWLLS
nr:inner membrane protein [Raoultella sp. NCTC 9187]